MTHKPPIDKADSELLYGKLFPVLREVAELIGPSLTKHLVARYGGTTITVPSTTQNNNHLVRLLGPEAAAKLVLRYAGTNLYISKTDRAPNVARDIEIYQRHKNGLASVMQLAREYSLSDRRVWEIIKQQKNAARAALKKALNAP